jgi:CBS domain-containing protein
MAMQAKDVMTTRVVSVTAKASVLQAAQLMLQNRISGLPVVDDGGHLVGIVTEGDFLRRGEIGTQRRRARWLEFLIGPGRLANEYVRACGRKVDEIMTRDVHTISRDTPLVEAVNLMERHRIKRLPVVHGRKLVGIVSRANLVQALASLARKVGATNLDDAAIRQRLMTELSKWSWVPHNMLNVIVCDRAVDLWGSITDYRERQALIVAAENVPGVKSVHDHLVWIEPMSGMAVLPPEEEEAARAKAS